MIAEDVDSKNGLDLHPSNNDASQRRMKGNLAVQDYSFMTDRQLIEMCGRLTSCQNWMRSLNSELLNEKAKLIKHGQALREQIRSLDAQDGAAASPALVPPSADVTENLQRVDLSIPEELVASTDANGQIQLTWFYDEALLECLNDAMHPLKALSFQVKQQTEGLNGHLRTRYHTIPCSGQIEEHRFAPPGCIASRTYSFSIRARGRYEGEDDERVSPYCEPVEATPTGKALPGSNPAEMGLSQPLKHSRQSDATSKDVASQDHTEVEVAVANVLPTLVSDSAESVDNAAESQAKQPLVPRSPDKPKPHGPTGRHVSIKSANDTQVLFKPTEQNMELVDGSLDKLQQEEAELRKAMDQLQEEKAGFAADLEVRMKAIQACQVGTDRWKRLGENRSAYLDTCSPSSGDGIALTTFFSIGTPPIQTVEENEDATKKDCLNNVNGEATKTECLHNACQESDLVDEVRKVNGKIEVTRGINMTYDSQETAFVHGRSCMGTPDKKLKNSIDPRHNTPPTSNESPCSVKSSGTMLVCPASGNLSPACYPRTSTPLTKSPPTIRVQDQAHAVSQEQIAECKVDLARVKLEPACESSPACGEANRCRDEASEHKCDEKDASANYIRLVAYQEAVGPRVSSEKKYPKAVEGEFSLAPNLNQAKSRMHELLHEKLRQLDKAPSQSRYTPLKRIGADKPGAVPRAKSMPRMGPRLNVSPQGLPAQQEDRLSQTQEVVPPPNMEFLRPSYSDVKMAQSGNAQDTLERMTSRELSTRALSSSRRYLPQMDSSGNTEEQLSRSCMENSVAAQASQVAGMRLPRSDVEAPPRASYPAPTRMLLRLKSQRSGDTASQSTATTNVGGASENGEVTFTIMHSPQMQPSSRSSYATSHPVSRDISVTSSTIEPKVFAHTPEKREKQMSPLWPVASEVSPQPHREGALSRHPAAYYSPQQYHLEASPMKARPSPQYHLEASPMKARPSPQYHLEASPMKARPSPQYHLEASPMKTQTSVQSSSNGRAASVTQCAGAIVTGPTQLQSPQIISTTIPPESSVLGAAVNVDGVENSRPNVVIPSMAPQPRSNSRSHPCHVHPQVEVPLQRSNSRSRMCHVQPQMDMPQQRSNSRSHPCHVQAQMDMPQQRSNSRSQYCVSGANACNLSLQSSLKSQGDVPQSTRNSQPHPQSTVKPIHFVPQSLSEVSQTRSTSRPQNSSANFTLGTSPQKEPCAVAPSGHQPPLVQTPVVMPGSSLQTHRTLAAVPIPRSLSHDSFRSRSFNPDIAQTFMFAINAPFSGDAAQRVVERNNVGLIGATASGDHASSLMPSFPMANGFQGPHQPFHFAPSSQCSPQVNDQIPSFAIGLDDKDLPPPPRCAPGAFQHPSQTETCGAVEPPPPPRMAPANFQNLSSSVEAPPPPRCAPAAGACAHVQGSTARGSSRGAIRPHINGNHGHQFTLKVQSSDDRWETCTFSDCINLDEQAGAFLRQHNLKSAFQVGLLSKMHQMIASGQKQATVDIVDLI